MVMVGALLGILPVLSLESLQKALQEHLPSRHQRLLPLNYQALQAGLKYAQQGV
jgi:2-oxoglutarate ferredoxin oxidoreductase subunit gamma